MRLDPADLRAFARRDWARLERLDCARRACAPIDEKVRIAIELYEAARATRPGWPTDADRLDDLREHVRLSDLLRRAPRVGAR